MGKLVNTIIKHINPIATPKEVNITFNAAISFFCLTVSSSFDKTASDKDNVASKALKKGLRE